MHIMILLLLLLFLGGCSILIETPIHSIVSQVQTAPTHQDQVLIDTTSLAFKEQRVLEESYKVGDTVTVTVQRSNEARDIQTALVDE